VNAYEKEIKQHGGLTSMGKTVESFRIALEREINRWSGFARALRKPDREAFEEIVDRLN
jgi:preprotein translocase subunit Sss1